MESASRFDEETGIQWMSLTGEITYDDILSALEGALAAGHTRRIWDIRGTTNRLSHEEMLKLAARLREGDGQQSIRTAILTETDLQFGMSRSLQPRVDTDRIRLGVFRDVDDAVAWVSLR